MTEYLFIAVRDASASRLGAAAALLHPLPGSRPGAIRAERHDGADAAPVATRGIVLRYTNGKRDLLASSDLRGHLIVTDARVAFLSCDHRDATWRGGRPPRLATAGETVLTARGGPGSMLVGHVRHPWLHGVYADPGQGAEPGMVRLFVETSGRMLRIDVGLDEGVDAAALALDVARRAARFRLEHTPAGRGPGREELELIARRRRLVTPRSQAHLPGIGFPAHEQVSERSARCHLAVA